MNYILASQSPRRTELLGLLNIPFLVRVADIDEAMDASADPRDEVARVSRLKALAVPREADDIVIAGMGGEQIAAILQAAPFVKNTRYRLLLQPMSRAEKLREYLLTNGFLLEHEEVVCEGDRLYVVLQAAFADAPPVTDSVAYYIGALPASGNDSYWQQLCARLEQRMRGLASGGGDAKEIEEQRRLLTQIHAYWQEGRTP